MSEALLGRRLRASGLWAATGRILSGVLLLVLHGVLARRLSGGDYGRYVLIESLALLLSTICLAGVPTVTLRMMRAKLAGGDPASAAQIVRVSLMLVAVTSLITVTITFAVSRLTAHSLPAGLTWRWLPWFAAWAVLAAGLRQLSEVYRGYDRFSVAYCIGGQSGGLIVNACLLLLSGAAIASGSFTLGAILSIQLLVHAVFLLLGAGELLKTLAPSPTQGASKASAVLFFSAWPLLAQQLVSVGLPEAGKLLLGFYATAEASGLYNGAFRLVLLAHVPLLVVNNAVQPFIAELHSGGDRRRLMILTRGSATLAAVPCMAVLLVFLVFPKFVLQSTFGADFVAAAPALQIMVVGSMAWVLSGSCGLVLMMTGHERSCMLGTLIPGVAYLLFSPFIIERYGVPGAAACASALQVGSNALCLLLVYYHQRLWTAVTVSLPVVRECCRIICGKGLSS